jgi:hypothetical protein
LEAQIVEVYGNQNTLHTDIGGLGKHHNELYDTVAKLTLLLHGIVEEIGNAKVDAAIKRWEARVESERTAKLKEQIDGLVAKGALVKAETVAPESLVVLNQTLIDGSLRREHVWVKDLDEASQKVLVGRVVGDDVGVDMKGWKVLEVYAVAPEPVGPQTEAPAVVEPVEARSDLSHAGTMEFGCSEESGCDDCR